MYSDLFSANSVQDLMAVLPSLNGVNSNWKIANWEGVCYDRTDGERL